MSTGTMRKTAFTIVLSALSLAVFQAAALADGVEGRVAQTGTRSVDMVVYDAQGRPYPNTLRLEVDNYTRLNGFSSLSQLRREDPIGADVYQQENGAWKAGSITLFQQVDARPATQKPSPGLRDVLGNPVARGALVGAATGALASSASGGKAGKGALVGAGVGAAAGLLEGLFSQRSDDSQG